MQERPWQRKPRSPRPGRRRSISRFSQRRRTHERETRQCPTGSSGRFFPFFLFPCCQSARKARITVTTEATWPRTAPKESATAESIRAPTDGQVLPGRKEIGIDSLRDIRGIRRIRTNRAIGCNGAITNRLLSFVGKAHRIFPPRKTSLSVAKLRPARAHAGNSFPLRTRETRGQKVGEIRRLH